MDGVVNITQRSADRARQKAEEERQLADQQRQEHEIAEQLRAEEKTTELLGLLSQVSPDLAVRIRLEAAVSILGNPALYGAQKQIMMDERALELASYAVKGVAR